MCIRDRIIITLIATGGRIAFFGYLTVVLVNIRKKIGIGVGIAVLIFFVIFTNTTVKYPKNAILTPVAIKVIIIIDKLSIFPILLLTFIKYKLY